MDVSYTHLDVYKRQILYLVQQSHETMDEIGIFIVLMEKPLASTIKLENFVIEILTSK